MSIYAGEPVNWQFPLYSPNDPFGASDHDPNTDFTAVLVRNSVDTNVTVTLTHLSTGLYSATALVPDIWRQGDDLAIRVTATVEGVTQSGIIWQDTIAASPISVPQPSLGQVATPIANPDHFGGAQVHAKRPTIRLRAGYEGTVTHTLLSNGVPFDLSIYGFGYSEVGGFSEPTPNMYVHIAEMAQAQNSQIVPVDILDSVTGDIRFTIPTGTMACAGIWLLEFYITTQDGAEVFLTDAYLHVERSGRATSWAGAPTVAEVRMFLRDYAQENELLDAVDFDGSEIAFAAELCVSEWNESDPWDGPKYDTHSFPFRRNWLVGISGYLFGIAAEHYARNQMQKDGGAISYDDKAKAQMYQQKSMVARQEWSAFVASRKTVLAGQAGFQEIGGVYYGW